jgi:Rrf2 family protein
MKLSSRARHALRLALEVYRNGSEDKPVQLSEVSRITGISRGFLEQLAVALKSHSLIRGISGRKGGYVLARPADEITIGQVLTAVMGPVVLSVCTEDQSVCMSSEFCECRLVWQLLKQRIDEVLSKYTLADIASKNWIETIREQIHGKIDNNFC